MNILKIKNNVYITNYPKALSRIFLNVQYLYAGYIRKKELFNTYRLFDTKYNIFADYAKWLSVLCGVGGGAFDISLLL